MKRYISFLVSLLVSLSLCGCKLSISDFVAPDTSETGRVITLSLSGYAEDIGNNALEHGVILQLPDNWEVVCAKTVISPLSSYWLTEKPAYEPLYATEPDYKVWVGTSSFAGSGDRTVTATIKVLTGDFSGNAGDTRNYTLKVCAGVYRNGAWVTDDPEGEFNFSNITDEKYVESIIVEKAPPDDVPPDPVSTLTAEDLCTGSDIHLDWSGYDEDGQGDVVKYHIYQSESDFTDVSGITAIEDGTLHAGIFSYTVGGLTAGVEYFFAVTALDEVSNENKSVTPLSIVPQEPGSISGGVTDEYDNPMGGLSVYAYDYSTGDYVSDCLTQADGSYVINGLYPGTYRVYVSGGEDYGSEYYDNKLYHDLADPVSVTGGQETTGINFELAKKCRCDLNHDGRCDMQDWLLFGEDWGRTDCPSTEASSVTSEIDSLKKEIQRLQAQLAAKDKEIRAFKGE